MHDAFDISIGKRVQLNHARTRNERRIHLETRVFRCGANEHHRAVFNRMQKRILLAAIEAVDFVHEQNRAQPACGQALFRSAYLAAQVGHRAPNGGNFHK